ncbi:hypothetical protein L2E82_52820 [Cichorium intybus]|nr:hypothetical protein L2E82_52820 [Cichorium intybus]
MEPFPSFGLQSSHLNICYYHQDPHRRPLRPGSRPRFCSDRRALLLIGAWPLAPTAGCRSLRLSAIHFSGLVDSAVSLRASTRVSSGFAPLRHSSPSFGSRQACSHSNPSQKIKVGRPVHPARGIPPISFLAPCGFTHPLTRTHVRTPWSVFQDGPNGVPTGRCRGARRGLGPGPPLRTPSPDYNSDSEAARFSSWADPGSLRRY